MRRQPRRFQERIESKAVESQALSVSGMRTSYREGLSSTLSRNRCPKLAITTDRDPFGQALRELAVSGYIAAQIQYRNSWKITNSRRTSLERIGSQRLVSDIAAQIQHRNSWEFASFRQPSRERNWSQFSISRPRFGIATPGRSRIPAVQALSEMAVSGKFSMSLPTIDSFKYLDGSSLIFTNFEDWTSETRHSLA